MRSIRYVRPANVSQTRVQVIRADSTMTSNVNLWIQNAHILGNASIENLDFKLLESKIEDVDQSTFGDLGLFGAEFLEKLLTEILQMGLVIPSMRGVVLRSPRYFSLTKYFERKIDHLVSKNMFMKIAIL